MKTKYLSALSVTFNPFSPTRWHKTPRLFLSFVPPAAAAQGLKIKTTILPQNSTERSRITVGYKDGKTVVFEGPPGDVKAGAEAGKTEARATGDGALDLSVMGVEDVLAEVDRHSRLLGRKDELTN